MQILLTEEEYNELKSRIPYSEHARVLERFQHVCTMAADNTPVDYYENGETVLPWGCIITKGTGYCDSCPVREFCPKQYKSLSK